MRTIKLVDLIAHVEARKAELGIAWTDSDIEALRNNGAARRPEKRELLRRAAERAKTAGRNPVVAHF